MKILLVQYSPYIPTHGGASKTNRMLCEQFAGRGHTCRVVALANGIHGSDAVGEFYKELERRGLKAVDNGDGVVLFKSDGVEVHAIINFGPLRNYFQKQIDEFQPDWVFTTSEDGM